MKVKLAVFDYCETLVNAQTGNKFIEFYFEKNGGLLKKIAIFLISNLRIFKPRRKKMLLRLLSGQSLVDIQRVAELYVESCLVPAENTNVIASMRELWSKGYEVVILSAGYSVYISAHNKRLQADKIIANDFFYLDSIFTGRMVREDCYGKYKLDRLEECYSNQTIDYENSYFFSDCMSDLPLFNIFGNSFLVTKENIAPFKLKHV